MQPLDTGNKNPTNPPMGGDGVGCVRSTADSAYRDQLALIAFTALINGFATGVLKPRNDAKDPPSIGVAKNAYAYADAMLAERERNA